MTCWRFTAEKEHEEDGCGSVLMGLEWNRGGWCGGDKDVRMFLKMWVGYSLTEHIAKAKHTCGPGRCCGHSRSLSERKRQCEKLMCPTYSS